MVGTRQPLIARLENGTSVPSLSFLDRIAKALDARIELHIVLGIDFIQLRKYCVLNLRLITSRRMITKCTGIESTIHRTSGNVANTFNL